MADIAQANRFDTLPPELWPRIFAHVKPQQLLSLRLVCHRWKVTVDRERSLWDRICIKIPDGVTLDQNFRATVAPAVTCIKLNRVMIVSVDRARWWVSLGSRLTCIELRDCRVSLETLLGMLRSAPNLRRLSMRYTEFSSVEEPVVNFKLDKMEELELYFESLFDVYVRIFPRLQRFSFDQMESNWDGIRDRLINSVQGTLKHLGFYPTAKILNEMSSMDRLQLSSVELLTHMQNNDQYDAARLSRIQPLLKKLVMPGVVAESTILCEIGRNLRELKLLDACIDETESTKPTFLARMPNLEKLTLRAALKQQGLDFAGITNPNLKQAHFWYFSFEQTSMSAFLIGSPSLQNLSLSDCVLDSAAGPETNVEELELLDGDGIPNKALIQLTTCCTRLKTLTLRHMPHVDDATFRILYRALPQLKRLTLEVCDGLTIAGVRHILDRWPAALQRLEIESDCEGLHDGMRKLVQREGRISLDRFAVGYNCIRPSGNCVKETYRIHKFSR